MSSQPVDFDQIGKEALLLSDAIVQRWLPDGRRAGAEWVVRNPRRNDRIPGSFKINLRTGRWADFAISQSGGDLISLAAYLFGLNQVEAARRVAEMIGISHHAD